ncbi:MAG: hypothetical protein K6T65_08425 [Peptococcaceae bacterium]|nr:hypothetical protein [Peptococcaceae bacterium]
MRDDERILMYYEFGTMDWYSEAARPGEKEGKTGGVRGAVRYLKLVTLLWSLVLRNLSVKK